MPTDGDFGYSAETHPKNRDFGNLLRMQLQIASANNKVTEARPYRYFDLNAGPGRWMPPPRQPLLWDSEANSVISEIRGSPLLFLEAATLLDIPYRAVFFEKDKRHRLHLTKHTAAYPNVVIANDHDDAIAYCGDQAGFTMGLVYSDESAHIPPFDLLARMSQQQSMQYVDICIYYSATAHKRARCKNGGNTLLQYLAQIQKKHWIIREPRRQAQWTFLLGTQWADFPSWRRAGFHSVSSSAGRDVLRLLNYSANELMRQGELDDTIPYLLRVPEASALLDGTGTGV